MKLIERWHRYEARAGQILANRSARLPMPLENDAPFCLRAIAAYRNANTDGSGLATGVGGLLRFADAMGNWLSVNLTDMVEDIQVGGQFGRVSPIWEQVVYPAGAVISYDLANETAVNFNDVRIIFWGTKLYPEGGVWAPTYPPCYNSNPVERPVNVTITQGATLRQIPINVASDADLVIRGFNLQPDASSPAASWTSMYVRLYDRDFKSYQTGQFQDGFIHVDWTFGSQVQRPALIYPEIYVPRNEAIYMDLMNLDAGGLSLRLQLNCIGAKVYEVKSA